MIKVFQSELMRLLIIIICNDEKSINYYSVCKVKSGENTLFILRAKCIE